MLPGLARLRLTLACVCECCGAAHSQRTSPCQTQRNHMTLGDDLPDVKPYFPFGTARPGEPAQRWSTTASQPQQVVAH